MQGADGRPVVPLRPVCTRVDEGYGPAGATPISTEVVVSGLEVPWVIGFLPNGDWLITERPGRVRLLRGGKLVPEPVARLAIGGGGESGLLGLAVDPSFATTRAFFLYVTREGGNQVERWKLSEGRTEAALERVLLAGIPSASRHDGGRLRFGPGGMLYVGTGDSANDVLSQDLSSLAGKLRRIAPDGTIPADNPFPGSPVFAYGIRNTQGFDWRSDGTMLLTDHGPSGAAIYTGDRIPEWRGDLIVGTLASEHLHRVDLSDETPPKLVAHEVYLAKQHGRLREVIMGPDRQLDVTTSNCGGRGECPPEKDAILRVTR